MTRILTLALALAATPAWAAGPGFSISGARVVGIPGLPEVSALVGERCGASGRTQIAVTFTDPDGISYASVEMRSAQVRPAVSDRAETWLWLPSYARPKRDYQWRYEELSAARTRYTMTVMIELVPNAGPIPTEVVAKDGNDAMTIRTFALVPDACR